MDQKKKRVRKTQLVATLVLSCFLASFSYVKATGSEDIYYFNFTHGQCTQAYYYDIDSLNILYFTFDDFYSGTVTLNFSYSGNIISRNLDFWNIAVDNGKIDSYQNTSSASKIIFHVYNAKAFSVIMTHHPTGSQSDNDIRFQFTSASSNLTKVTDSVPSDVHSIDTKLTTTNSTLSTISNTLHTANVLQTTISGDVTDIEAYLADMYNGVPDSDVEDLLDTIRLYTISTSTDVRDCENYLSNIRNQMTAIQDVLGTQNPNNLVPDILTCMNNIVSSQSNLENTLTNIYNDIHTMTSDLNNVKTTLNNIKNTLDNIDNLIDTISWSTISNNNIGWSTNNNGVFDYSNGSRPFENDVRVYFDTNIPLNANYMNGIIKVILPYAVTNSNYDFISKSSVEIISSNGNSLQKCDYYIKLGYASTELYLYNIVALPYNSSYSLNLRITLSETTRNIYKYTNSSSISFISNTDIEYWYLISYFQQVKSFNHDVSFDQDLYQRLSDIITAINNINVTVNVTDQEITNVTNNFDSDIDIIHNIENNYGLNFDSWDDQLTSNDIALDLQTYNATINLFKTNITSLWSSPIVSMPIILSCLVFVFLVILG